MNKFFIALYDFFESRRALLYALLGALVVAMGAAALQLRFSENITGFFPDGERKAAAAFSNLKIKDKIAVMINAGEDAADKTDEMMACADSLAARLNADTLFRRYAEVEATFGSELADGMRSFLQGNLPLLLSEADYARMDTLVTPQGIAQAMEGNYRRLLSPVGGFIDEYIYDDPLGLSFGALGKLQELNIGGSYTLCDDYLFSKDMTTLLVFISPHYQSGDTGVGDRLIERIESALEGLNAEYAAAGITADYYGGPAVAAYNARQIKRDMMLTLNVAILIIVAFITLSFRNKFAVLLALIPVALGALFALAIMSLTCHTISSIAVGAGTVVMGIALSYSIHILCHANHCHDPRQIIRDLAYPLTIGSITTIGAFAGLLFTDSQLLRDFGLFASLTLVGTTLFSLVLLPHLIRKEKRGGGSAVLERVERLTGMRPDRNRPLVAAILLLTFICLFFFNRIGFDSDMMHLNYDPPRLAAAQQRLSRLTDEDGERSKVLFITTANDLSAIPGPLRDRMDVIELPSYTRVEKYNIARKHLVPKQLDACGLTGKVTFSQSALYGIIDGYTREAGVRNLERTITSVLRKCARKIASGEAENVSVTGTSLEKLLGPRMVKPEFLNRTNAIGIANGLAWTSIGGETLPIEVQVIDNGSGKITVTGSLGDVMKESAQLAITYARVHAAEYGIDSERLKKCDLHIHAPEGAVPKDGPSAGVTLTTALISCLSGIPVRGDVAMTGEITLHGNVLPIGGLREKSMAAYREGMKTVLIPKDNVSDLYEVDDEVKKNIEFLPMSNLSQVLAAALLKPKTVSAGHPRTRKVKPAEAAALPQTAEKPQPGTVC